MFKNKIQDLHGCQAYLINRLDEFELILENFLPKTKVVFADTEFMREKTYWPILCLLQIRIDDHIFCIDTLIPNINESLNKLCLHDVEWVFHASKQEIEIFNQITGQFNFKVFDTQLAAEMCGFDEQIGYAKLVENICNKQLDKSQTRTNWQRRPLSKKQLVYASEDVAYLKDIYCELTEILNTNNRMSWLVEDQGHIVDSLIMQQKPENAYKRFKNGWRYNAYQQNMIKAIAKWRESKAQNLNVSRNKIIRDQDIYEIISLKDQNHFSADNISITNNHLGDSVNIIDEIKDLSPINEGVDFIWSKKYIPTKEEKNEVKEMMNKINTLALEENMTTSRIARKKDIENFVFENKGLLTKGWREKLVKKIAKNSDEN